MSECAGSARFDGCRALGPYEIYGQRGVRQWSVSASLPEGRFKALFERGAEPQLFQLDVDPGEQRNLAPRHAEILRRLIASAPSEMVGGLEAGPAQEVPEDVRQRLAEIGYADELDEEKFRE